MKLVQTDTGTDQTVDGTDDMSHHDTTELSMTIQGNTESWLSFQRAKYVAWMIISRPKTTWAGEAAKAV